MHTLLRHNIFPTRKELSDSLLQKFSKATFANICHMNSMVEEIFVRRIKKKEEHLTFPLFIEFVLNSCIDFSLS